MATEVLGSLVYEIGADVTGLQNGIRNSQDSLNGLNGNVNLNSRSISNMETRMNSAGSSMSRLSSIAASLTAALSVQQVASYADAWTVLNNKVANSVRQGEQQADVMQRIFDISQATQSSLNGTATLYARLERGTRLLNTSSTDLAKLTTIINQGFAVSGATTQEAENAIVQLSQGLAAGALRGEEFNSVSEQGSRLMIALADSLGVSLGELRAMAAQGKITNEVIVNGLLSQGDAIGKEFAKTTVSISQGLLVAGNNVTKFFGENSTVKSFAAGFRDSVITMSENLELLSGALILVAGVMGSRYVGALTLATAAKIKTAISSREQAAADQLSAQAAANKATAELRVATITKERAIDEVRLAEMMRMTAISATAATAAEQRLSAARVAAATAVDNYNRALAANRAAQSGLSSGAGLLSRTLGLIGGPVGAAMLAGAAILYFTQRSKEAREAAVQLADSTNDLIDKFKTMSSTQVAASIAKLRQNIPELTNAVDEAQQKFESASRRVANLQREIEKYGTSTTRGRQASAVLTGALDEQAISADNLERAQNRLSRVNSAVYIGQVQLTGGMKQGIDLLKRNGDEASVTAGMMNKLGEAINFASRAKTSFNSSSLMIERPKKVQEYLDKLQDQIELEGVVDERLRAQLKTEKEIRALGGSDADVRMARERAGAEFDLQKAQEERKRAENQANSEAKKSANQAETVAIKLEKMKQATELATSSTENLSREQAILRAQQSLGKGATEENIKLAGEYAAAQWDAAKATQALSLIPALGENQQYQADLQALQAALNTKKIDQDTYYAAVEKREQEHQITLAKIRAEKSVSPTESAAGEVDPIQELMNQHTQQIAMITQFEQQGVIAHQNAIMLKRAADTEYNEAVIAANWDMWTKQNEAAQIFGSAFDSATSSAASGISNILKGTGDLNDALYGIADTVLQSVVQSFVQMGVDWVKSAIMGQTAQIAATTATTAASVAGTATTTAASTSAAAVTTAAWTPAAIVASIGSFGGAAAIGIGAVLGALAMGVAGRRKNGGSVSASSMYQVGENGLPEIFQASNGRQYMIPGDNGSVISNKDLSSGGGGVVVYNNIINNSSSRITSSSTQNTDGSVTIQTIVSDIEEGGEIGQAISRTYETQRRANG